MKRSLFYVIVAAVQSLGSIGGPLVAARFLGAGELGYLAISLLVVVLTRAFAALGLYGPVSVALHDGEAGVLRARRLLRWSGLTCLPVGLVLAVVGLGMSGDRSTIILASAAGCAGAVALGHQALHRSVTNHLSYAAAVLGPTAIANGAGLATILATGGGARDYVGAMAFASLVTSALLHVRHVRAAGAVDADELRPALRMGFPLVLTAAATVGLSLGDRPLIGFFLDEADVGRYHLIYIIAAGGIPLLGALNNSWLPVVLNMPVDSRMGTLARSTSGVVKGMMLFSIGAAVAAPVLVSVIGGPEFITRSTPWVSVAVGAGVLPYAIYSGMSIGLLSIKATDSIAISMVAGAVANIGLNLVLIPWLGLVGAGLASFLGYALAAILSWRRLGGQRQLPWWDRTMSLWAVGFAIFAVVAGALPVDGWTAGTFRLVLGAAAGLYGCLSVARATSNPA